MSKQLLFSVTIKDCRVDAFTVGGHGGAGKDTSNTGVRITHIASGATGESTETRSQFKNKQTAFRRMAESKTFKQWHKIEVAKRMGVFQDVDAWVENTMRLENIRVETKDSDGKWQIALYDALT